MKLTKLLTVFIAFLFLLNVCNAQEQKPFELGVSNTERCFVFSSLDWFTTVSAYNSNFDRIFTINVKTESSKSNSQLVTESFDYVYDDYSYFVFKKANNIKIVKFDSKTQNYNYISKEEFKHEKEIITKQKHVYRR